MRRPNGGVIWLLLAGVAIAFAFNQVVGYFLQIKYFIPSFIILVLSGYITARVIGRAGGEFSEGVKSYSILLEGFTFGLVFDLIRMRYDWFINVFKHIAIGTFFILIAMVFKRNIEKYQEEHPKDGPHLGLMRLPILYILAGFCFALTINSITEAFLQNLYYIALLPFLVGIGVFVMITAKADFDLLDAESGPWQQLIAGGALGVTFDLIFFRVITGQNILSAFVVFAVFIITATVVRMKEATEIKPGGVKLDLKSKKSKKVIGTIQLESKTSSSTKTYTRQKKERSSKYTKDKDSKKRS